MKFSVGFPWGNGLAVRVCVVWEDTGDSPAAVGIGTWILSPDRPTNA